MELTTLKLALPYLNLESFGFALVYTWLLLIGFMVYDSAKEAWPRMKVGIKILVSPVLIVFGVSDVLFDATAGTVMFGFELPGWHKSRFTFSSRCAYHKKDSGFRGVIARAFCTTLNSIMPGHCGE